jgi:hypothetical protein
LHQTAIPVQQLEFAPVAFEDDFLPLFVRAAIQFQTDPPSSAAMVGSYSRSGLFHDRITRIFSRIPATISSLKIPKGGQSSDAFLSVFRLPKGFQPSVLSSGYNEITKYARFKAYRYLFSRSLPSTSIERRTRDFFVGTLPRLAMPLA